MKIVSIEIIGFGKWTDKTFQFSPENQLIFGENETGKSTMYQFIQAIIFGFPTKSKRKKDYQPKNGGAYGGSVYLTHPVYGPVRIERFKGKNKGQAKVYCRQQIRDEKFLEQMIHPLTKELFQSVFTFQSDQLNELSNLQEEELQTLLLSLGISGSQQLLTARERYNKQAQVIYKGKGVQPPLNQKLLEFEELEQQISKKKQQESQFGEILQQSDKIEKELKIKQIERNILKEKVHISEQQVRNLSLYEELQTLDQTDLELDDHAVIDSAQHKELLSVYQKNQFLIEEMSRLTQRLMKESNKTTDNQLHQYYLKEDEIKRLVNRRYEMEKIANELDWANQSLKKNRQEMRLLEEKWDWNGNQPPELFLSDNIIHELSNESVKYKLAIQRVEQKLSLLNNETGYQDQKREEQVIEPLNRNEGRKAKHERKKINSYLITVAVLLLTSSVFFNGVLKYLSFGLGLALTALGLFPLFFSKKTKTKIKTTIQKKTYPVDDLIEQKLNLEYEKKELLQQAYVFDQNLAADFKAAGFGRMNRVDLLVDHRNEITHYQRLTEMNQELTFKITDHRLVLTKYEALIEKYVKELGIADCVVQEKIQKLIEFIDQMESFRFNQESQEDTYLNQRINEVKNKKEQLANSTKNLIQSFDISSIDQIPVVLKKYQKLAERKKRREELVKILGTLYEEAADSASVQQNNELLVEQMKQMDIEMEALQAKEQELLYTKQQMLTDGTLDELYQKQILLKNQVEELAIKWSSHLIAGNIIIDMLTELSENQLPMLLNKASHYFRILTQDNYLELQLDEGKLIAVCPDRSFFGIQDLSTGAKDQLIMALRFGFLALYANRMICPIIIDDGWLYYDSVRKKILAELLATFATKQQVICFSSDQEMLQYYKELNQPIIELS